MSKVITIESNDLTTPHINYIQYEGIVDVTLKQNNKIISKKTYFNNGGDELFKFLCKSLENSYDAKTFRPTKIKLFYNSNEDPSAATNPNDLQSGSSCITANEIKTLYGVLPTEEASTTNKTWYTTLHFTIPNILIHGELTEEFTGKINEIRLYPENTDVDSGGEYDKYSADFKFTKNGGKEWDPIIINNAKHNYNLIITWTLSFTNK